MLCIPGIGLLEPSVFVDLENLSGRDFKLTPLQLGLNQVTVTCTSK